MKKLFTVLPLVLATSAAMAYEQDKTYQFTILHTNDTHGHFWPNAKGEYGFPAHKTIVNRVKAEVEQKGGSLVLLNAGDFNTGVPESVWGSDNICIRKKKKFGGKKLVRAPVCRALAFLGGKFMQKSKMVGIGGKWSKIGFYFA